jgi:hypothetical protein
MMLMPPTNVPTFGDLVLKDKEYRGLIVSVFVLSLIVFSVFKVFYPFAHVVSESYLEIEAAQKNWSIGYLPIGYAMFIRLVSSFSSNDLVLVFVQYVLLQVGVLYFLFSIKYLFSFNKVVFSILLSISMLNPILLYISNLITSDSLTGALMLFWFAHLLWIVLRPSVASIWWHCALLILLFMVRYGTWYCVIISTIGFLSYVRVRRIKLIGIGLVILFFGGFIGGTQMEFYRRTGVVQMSPQWGWQKAANAINAYTHADTVDRKRVRGKFEELQGLVNEYVAGGMSNDSTFGHQEIQPVGYYQLSKEHHILEAHMWEVWRGDDSSSAFKKWGSLGPLYDQYGNYLIKTHPDLYWKYSLLPNLRNYYVPSIEALYSYNGAKDTVGQEIVDWFQWKSNKVFTAFDSKKFIVPIYFAIFVSVINLVFVLSFLSVFLVNGLSSLSLYSKRVLVLLSFTWLSNCIWNVLTSYIVLRQQIFIFQITFTFCVLFVFMIFQIAFKKITPGELVTAIKLHPNPQ